MADSIVRLRVDSQEYDNKLKRAAEGLNRYIEGCRKAGGTLEHVDDGVMEFTRSLSKMDTVAGNTKGKLGEMTKAFTELTMEYNRMTDAEKNSQFGRALNAELEQVKRNIISTKQELAGIQGSLSGGSGFKDVLNGVAGKFGMSASMFTGVGAAVAGAAGAFKLLGDNINLAMNFEKSMSQLSSLTGMVGKDLDQLKEYAIELGSTSTLTASQVADAFRLIGSQQPQLLESGQALKEVTKYAITLSEAAGIDLQTAAQTLSTSINQMGGDSNNAARYVNVLAAASQKGAGDIAWLGEAITKSATAAKAVGTDYEELVANLEQLAKAGFDASTAGTALRSIIMNLEKQANNDFKPSVVGLTKAFENLGKANLDIVGYQQIAGKMFASQAMALANAAQEAKNMTAAITGTNTALDQAKTNTANLDGAMKGLSSAWEGLNLHINASSGFLKDVVDWAAELIRKLDGVATAGGRAAKALRDMNGAGGSEGPTKVDQQINALRGSNHKRAAFNLTMQSYRQQLADYDQKIANGGKWESKDKPGFFHYENVDVLKAQRSALAQMAQEYQTRGLREIFPTPSPAGGKGGKNTITLDVDVDAEEGEKSLDSLKAKLKELKKLRDDAINKKDFKSRDTYNAQIKQVNAEIKNLRGGSTTTSTTHQTPQQRAQESFTKAEQNYKQALEQAAMELQAGTITRAEAKKKEMQAAEQRWKAIGDARNINDSENLRKAQDEAAAEYKRLAAEAKTAAEHQKAVDKATRDLENANQKLTDARREMAQAEQSGDRKAYYAAEKKVATAQQEVTRLETVKVNVEQGKVDLPAIPESKTMKVNIEATTSNLDAEISHLKDEMSQLTVGSEAFNIGQTKLVDLTTLKTLITEQMKNGLQIDPNFAQSMFSNILAGKDIENTTWQAQVDNINKNRTANGRTPLKINYKTGEKEGKNEDDQKKTSEEQLQGIQTMIGSLQSIVGGINQLGIELPQELTNIFGVLQTITGIVGAIQSMQTIGTFLGIFHNGGLIGRAAGGMMIPGNSMSGDRLRLPVDGGRGMIGVNSGELVLNRAQQGNLASQLEGVGQMSNGTPYITGELIFMGLNNYLKSTGRGEIMTSRFKG